ncbi:hypothetical protein A2U01_0052103, partial [Trifolium medium]|nr:hypothetical protein [Trifolium medium]
EGKFSSLRNSELPNAIVYGSSTRYFPPQRKRCRFLHPRVALLQPVPVLGWYPSDPITNSGGIGIVVSEWVGDSVEGECGILE